MYKIIKTRKKLAKCNLPIAYGKIALLITVLLFQCAYSQFHISGGALVVQSKNETEHFDSAKVATQANAKIYITHDAIIVNADQFNNHQLVKIEVHKSLKTSKPKTADRNISKKKETEYPKVIKVTDPDLILPHPSSENLQSISYRTITCIITSYFKTQSFTSADKINTFKRHSGFNESRAKIYISEIRFISHLDFDIFPVRPPPFFNI